MTVSFSNVNYGNHMSDHYYNSGYYGDQYGAYDDYDPYYDAPYYYDGPVMGPDMAYGHHYGPTHHLIGENQKLKEQNAYLRGYMDGQQPCMPGSYHSPLLSGGSLAHPAWTSLANQGFNLRQPDRAGSPFNHTYF